jgi:hypothetical protein
VPWIGRLGGHLNRKRDGMPGVRTLWRGFHDLALLAAGFRAGKKVNGYLWVMLRSWGEAWWGASVAMPGQRNDPRRSGREPVDTGAGGQPDNRGMTAVANR